MLSLSRYQLSQHSTYKGSGFGNLAKPQAMKMPLFRLMGKEEGH